MAGAEITFFSDTPAFRTSMFGNSSMASSTQAWSSTSTSRMPSALDNFPDPFPPKNFPNAGIGLHRKEQWGQQTQTQTQSVSMTRVANSVNQWTEVASTTSSHVFGSHWSTQSQSVSQESLLSDDSTTEQPDQDELQLPTEPLSVKTELGKGNVGRKGSLGGRRPPSSRSRRSNSGSVIHASAHEDPISKAWTTTVSTEVAAPPLPVTQTEGKRASPPSPKKKVPPPRPPPPKIAPRCLSPSKPSFINESSPETFKYFLTSNASPVSTTLREENVKTRVLPPPRPSMSPARNMSSQFHEPFDASPKADVVDVHDKESVEDGHVVRRRTVVTLGSSSRSTDMLTSPTPSEQPAWKRNLKARRSLRTQREMAGRSTPESPKHLSSSSFSERSYNNTDNMSTGSIKVTINGNSSLMGNTAVEEDSPPRRHDEAEFRPARASAFNVRRTIEQRRNAQQRDTRSPFRSKVDEDGYDGSSSSVAKSVSLTSIRHDDDSLASTPNVSKQDLTDDPTGSQRGRYLFGSAASSQLTGDRTISISMSFSDLDSSEDVSSNKRRGVKKTDAWYERRQSYGFEGADKWKAQNDDAASETSGRSTRISRSYDSIESRSVTNFESRIPPWLRTSPRDREIPESPENRYMNPELQTKETPPDVPLVTTVPSSGYSTRTASDTPSRTEKFFQKVEDTKWTSPSVESYSRPRSTTYLLEEENKPLWLRDLKARRSLRETKTRSMTTTPEPLLNSNQQDPPWKHVRLRPVGSKLLSEHGGSQTEPLNESVQGSKTFTDPRSPTPASVLAEVRVERTFEPSRRRSQPSDHEKPPTAVSPDDQQDPSSALRHQKSVELMRLLEETPYIFRNGEDKVSAQGNTEKIVLQSVTHVKPDLATDFQTPVQPIAAQIERIPEPPIFIATEIRPVNMPDPSDMETCSEACSLQTSQEDLTQPRKPKRVGFAQGVKEESDKMSRPKRRTRSPESRLREWQAKKETRFGDQESENSANKVTRFGDLEAEIPESAKVYLTPVCIPVTESRAETKVTTVSSTFLSILQRRPLDSITHNYSEPTGVATSPGTKQTSYDPTLNHRSSDTSSSGSTLAYATQAPAPIVHYPETDVMNIVVVSSQEPQPKSILKKRSMDNLLAIDNVTTLKKAAENGFINNPIFERPSNSITSEIVKPVAAYQPSRVNADNHTFSVTIIPSTKGNRASTPSEACPFDTESQSSISNASQPVITSPTPWGIQLKHVDPPRKIPSIEVKNNNVGSWLLDTRTTDSYQPRPVPVTSEPSKRFSSESSRSSFASYALSSANETPVTIRDRIVFNTSNSFSESIINISNQSLTLKDLEDDSEAEMSDSAQHDRDDCSSTAWSETSSIIQTNFDRENDHDKESTPSRTDSSRNSEIPQTPQPTDFQPFKTSHTIAEHFNEHLVGVSDPRSKTAEGKSSSMKSGSRSLEYDHTPVQQKPFSSLPSKVSPNPNTASEILSIRLRPIGRPKTPEYEEPDHSQAQPSLRKPLSPKVQRIDPRTITKASPPSSPYTDPAFYRSTDAYRIRNDMAVIKTRVKAEDLSDRKDNLSTEISNFSTEIGEKELDDNWTLSSPNRPKHSDNISESSQVGIGPKLPSLGNPSVSWTPIEKDHSSLRTNSLDAKTSPYKAFSGESTAITIQYSHSASSSQQELISDSPGKENVSHYEKDFFDTASKLSSHEFLPDPVHPWRKRRSSSIRSHDSHTSRDFDDCGSEVSGQHSDISHSTASARQSTEREFKPDQPEPEPDWIQHIRERSVERDWENLGKTSVVNNIKSSVPWIDEVKLRSPVQPVKSSDAPEAQKREETISPWKKELEERKRNSFQALINLERESAEFASSLQIKEDANRLNWASSSSFQEDDLTVKKNSGGVLTGGMPEDKASMLVRKFFNNAPNNPEPKFQKFAKTETILEETATESESVQDQDEKRPVSQTLSLDSDELFRLSTTDLTSNFGSVLDILNASVDQSSDTLSLYDDRSTTPKSLRLCAERDRPHVRLSDILKRRLDEGFQEDFGLPEPKPCTTVAKTRESPSSSSQVSCSDTRSARSTYSSSSSQKSSSTISRSGKLDSREKAAQGKSTPTELRIAKNRSTSKSQTTTSTHKSVSSAAKPVTETSKRTTKTSVKPQPSAAPSKTKVVSKSGRTFSHEKEEVVDEEGRSTKTTSQKTVTRRSCPKVGQETKEITEKRQVSTASPRESKTSMLRKKIRVKADGGHVTTTRFGTNGHLVTENVQNKSVSSSETFGGGGFTATREIRGDSDRRIVVQRSSNPSGVNSARSRTVTKSLSTTVVTTKRFNGTNLKTGL